MTADLDHAVRSSLGDIIATAPKPDDQPMRLVMVGGETRVRRPYLAVAASVVVLAGVGALVTLGTNDANTDSPAAAPLATDDASAPEPVATAPTTATVETDSSAVVDTTAGCAITGAQTVVPNVAGLPWVDAAAVLEAAGLESNALPELPAPFETPDADYYVIIRQGAVPGTIAPCGSTVGITVAYRPGVLYVVQEGDTFESIAASQGFTLEQLLGFNGLSEAELEASGQSPAAPLELGQALRLSIDAATLNTIPATTMP